MCIVKRRCGRTSTTGRTYRTLASFLLTILSLLSDSALAAIYALSSSNSAFLLVSTLAVGPRYFHEFLLRPPAQLILQKYR